MDKKELYANLKKIKKQIATNSKDAHYAENLIEQLLQVQKDIVVEPIELNVGERIDSFKGDYFEIVKTTRGCLYHEYGGYSIFATPNILSLYTMLTDYVENKDTYFELKDEEKEIFETQLMAVAHCLSVPKYCFSDVEFTLDLAKMVIKFLKSVYDKEMDNPLQEETIAEDENFKEVTLAGEDLKSLLKEASDTIKD